MSVGKSDSDQEKLFSIELLTNQQAADWAKGSTKTIYRWIETGQIPVVKFGNRTYRIPAGAVIAQLRQAGYDHLMEPKTRG
jgi:excisionase family DNA binding protein